MENLNNIIVLGNGWHPIMVFAMESDNLPTREFTGIVLAERAVKSKNPDKWCVWDIHRDTELESWHSTTGDYFDNRQIAEYAFGMRLGRRALPNEVARGVDRA